MAKARGLCLEDGCNRESEPTQTSRGHPNFTNGGNIADSRLNNWQHSLPSSVAALCANTSTAESLSTWQGIADPIPCRWSASSVGEEAIWPESVGARETPTRVLHPVKPGAYPPIHSECSHNRMHIYTYTTSLCHTSCMHY